MKLIADLLLWILTLLLTVTFTILARDPVQWVLARLLGPHIRRAARSITGLWEATYTYEEEDQTKSETQVIELRQFGKYVVGMNLTGQAHWNQIKGKVELQTYFTGLWRNTPRGDVYHGAFQLVINPRGDMMERKWLGFDKRHYIQHGPWRWELLSDSVTQDARAKALGASEA